MENANIEALLDTIGKFKMVGEFCEMDIFQSILKDIKGTSLEEKLKVFFSQYGQSIEKNDELCKNFVKELSSEERDHIAKLSVSNRQKQEPDTNSNSEYDKVILTFMQVINSVFEMMDEKTSTLSVQEKHLQTLKMYIVFFGTYRCHEENDKSKKGQEMLKLMRNMENYLISLKNYIKHSTPPDPMRKINKYSSSFAKNWPTLGEVISGNIIDPSIPK